MVHAAIERIQPGEVLVLAMPEPRPIALIGELLATQVKVRGAAAILVDAAVRDVEELRELGLPIWTRFVRAAGAGKTAIGELDTPVTVGGVRVAAGDIVVLDADGAVEHPTGAGRRGAGRGRGPLRSARSACAKNCWPARRRTTCTACARTLR